MPVFKYKAIEATGTHAAGSIEASTLTEAKTLLREQRLIILDLQMAATKRSSNLSISKEQLVILTSQLASLLSASVPLYEALVALEEQAKGDSYQPMITAIRESIRKGSSFSDALSKYPESFSPLYRAIVVAGESVGRLDDALLRLSQLLAKERNSRQQLISALLYPAILTVLLIGALTVLIFFVIPAIEGLFEGKKLHPFTQLVLAITHFVHNNTATLITGIVSLVAGIVYCWTHPSIRARITRTFLTWPIIGPFLTKSALSRFSRTLSNLLTGGTPLSSALVYAKEALTNQVLENEIESITQKIIGGETLSTSLQQSPYIPSLFARMARIGEETGRIAPILGNIAELYEEDSSRLLERAVSLLQPILLIAMGGIIGATLLAILLPLADFGTLLQTS